MLHTKQEVRLRIKIHVTEVITLFFFIHHACDSLAFWHVPPCLVWRTPQCSCLFFYRLTRSIFSRKSNIFWVEHCPPLFISTAFPITKHFPSSVLVTIGACGVFPLNCPPLVYVAIACSVNYAHLIWLLCVRMCVRLWRDLSKRGFLCCNIWTCWPSMW